MCQKFILLPSTAAVAARAAACGWGGQVRDSLGLTYDVNFDLSLFDRLQVGWFVVNVTSTPQKIQQALDASVGVLRALATQRITVRELARAQRTLLTRHESDTKVSLLGQTGCSPTHPSPGSGLCFLGYHVVTWVTCMLCKCMSSDCCSAATCTGPN